MKYWRQVLVFVLVCIALPHLAKAQSELGIDSAYLQSPQPSAPLDDDLYRTVRDQDDYSAHFTTEEEPEKYRDFEASQEAGELLRTLVIGFLYVLALVIVVLLILGLAKGADLFKPKNRKIEGEVGGYSLQEIEEQFQELDLEQLIQQAVNEEQYNLAVRLYYLEVLKQLSQNALITWKKNKTSRAYASELTNPMFKAEFQELTLIFNRVWYGSAVLTAPQYERVAQRFKAYLAKINQLPKTAEV